MTKARNLKAVIAIAKADLISTMRSTETVIFGLIFPLVFITVFGFIGGGTAVFDVALAQESAENEPVTDILREMDLINLVEDQEPEQYNDDLSKGKIDAVLEVVDLSSTGSPLKYNINVKTSAANPEEGNGATSIIRSVVDQVNLAMLGIEERPLEITTEIVEGRKYSQIDFILPGQLGFSLLNGGIFGTAFLLVGLRETLVLKRFFAAPVKKWVFITGISISKIVFSLTQAVVIIAAGYFFFGFTIINGFYTVFNMLVLSAIGLAIFLGVGLIISSVAKDSNGVSPIANLFTLPQFLLAGTFFPITMFPEWLQPISKILPLTYLNEALRKVAFEGEALSSLQYEITGLLVGLIIVYAIAIKVFKYDVV